MFIERTQNTTSLSQESEARFGKRENVHSSTGPVASMALALAWMLAQSQMRKAIMEAPTKSVLREF